MPQNFVNGSTVVGADWLNGVDQTVNNALQGVQTTTELRALLAGPVESTGWGTPSGGAAVLNFGGGTATLVQCSQALAEIIAVLKELGYLGS